MRQTNFIDVTKIEPKLKHPTIFNSFDSLLEGEAIVLHNDHDPKPLYYQLLGERGNIFSWSYNQSGPEIWEVEIRKHEKNGEIETLGTIVAKDLRKAEILSRYNLDYCCGGRLTLEEACATKGLDVLQLRGELEKMNVTKPSTISHDFNSWNLSFLCDYIINVHHSYVRKNMPIIDDLSQKVDEHHGKTHVELGLVRKNVVAMIGELTTHMKKEENILFPYIKKLENFTSSGEDFSGGFGSVQQPISVMENDHEVVGNLVSDIRNLTNNFTLPNGACNSYALLYQKLEEFEKDLHLHIHLENNILFVKAIGLEKQFAK